MNGTESCRRSAAEDDEEEPTDSYIAELLRDAIETAAGTPKTDESPAEAIFRARRQITNAMRRRPHDVQLLISTAEALLRAATVQHRIAPGPDRELADRMRSTLEMLGDLILPEDR